METTEKLRKDFKVNSTQHAFMVERTLAKEEYQKKCKAVRIDAAARVSVAKQVFEAEQTKINAVADEECARLQKEYFDVVAGIAAREDAFKDELNNYIASLEKERDNSGKTVD